MADCVDDAAFAEAGAVAAADGTPDGATGASSSANTGTVEKAATHRQNKKLRMITPNTKRLLMLRRTDGYHNTSEHHQSSYNRSVRPRGAHRTRINYIPGVNGAG